MSKLRTLRANQRSLGFFGGLRWTVLRAADRGGWIRNPVSVHPARLQHPLQVRMGRSSDPDVFVQIFVANELGFIDQLSSPRTIVDLGANVGYASALLLSAFPAATVIAVEPDPGNAAQCRVNLAPYGSRARVIQGAIWHSAGGLVLSRGTFGDGREWATEVRSARGNEVPDVIAYDIDGITPQAVDLLKIDIEGSEEWLFSQHTGWLDRVRNLCIEIHGPRCENAVFEALKPYRFARTLSGEYHVIQNLERR